MMESMKTMSLMLGFVPLIVACAFAQETGEAGGAAAAGPAEAETKVEMQHVDTWTDINEAVAVLHPTEGNDVRGTVRFQQDGEQVTVMGHIEGLEPDSTHAIHVHQWGDCTAPDATSAGGHYNPEGHPHNLPDEEPRHAGDMGNIEADAQGMAHFEKTFENFTVAGMKNPVIGRSVIVHASEDTGEGESGEAGARLACGVIGVAQGAGEEEAAEAGTQ